LLKIVYSKKLAQFKQLNQPIGDDMMLLHSLGEGSEIHNYEYAAGLQVDLHQTKILNELNSSS